MIWLVPTVTVWLTAAPVVLMPTVTVAANALRVATHVNQVHFAT